MKEGCADKKHLFIKIDGKYYFISAECLGEPLDCEGDVDKGDKIEDKLAEFLAKAEADESKADVAFAIWLKRCELLWGIFGSKS
jgi:hypothetical protein